MFIKYFLQKAGYVINRADTLPAIVDVRGEHNDARACFYYRRSVLVAANIREGIGLHHFSLAKEGCNPFVRACLAAGEGANRQAAATVLQKYYDSVQPKSAAAWLGFLDSDVPAFANIPASAVVQPWTWQTPSDAYNARKAGVPRENKQMGTKLPFSDGWHGCGPVSLSKISVESERLCRIIESVRENGLLRHDGLGGDIEVDFLYNKEGVSRWWIVSGHHRAAVLSAMGFKTVPVRVRAVIDRAHVSIWPNVVSGLYPQDVALNLFDRLIEGVLPESVSAWVDEIRENSGS